jgi:hypothetical protein
MSGRAKRVLVYALALLTAPLPVMPFEKGTRAFALSLVPCALFIVLASVYVLRGELGLRSRGLLGTKLVAATLITMAFGMALLAGSVVYIFVNL